MKNKKIAFCFVIVLAVASCFVKYLIPSSKNKVNEEETKINEKKDIAPPYILLTEEKFIVYQGDEINYKSFILYAYDDVDGDLIDKVKYTTIDTSKVGEYTVEYSVEDLSGNVATKELLFIVHENIE